MGRPRVLVTRAVEDAAPLARALEARGVEPVLLPLLAYAPGPDCGRVAAALAADPGAWVVVTSVRALPALLAASRPPGMRLAVIGPRSAEAARAAGLQVDLEGNGDGAAALATLLAEREAAGRALHVSGDRARHELEAGLRERGWEVRRLVVYETRCRVPDPDERAAAFTDLAAVCLASPSALEALLSLATRDREAGSWTRWPVAAIGSTTAEAARRAGFRRVVEALRPDAEDLADAAIRAMQED
jgi:uroporphyrinogen-III synthase